MTDKQTHALAKRYESAVLRRYRVIQRTRVALACLAEARKALPREPDVFAAQFGDANKLPLK